jgi:ABC-type nickel/cobalt efflux system permease component RcnA
MELEPEEERIVEAYLRASPEPSRRWVVTLVAGLVLCAAAVVMLLRGVPLNDPLTLLMFVLGMVIVACSLDYHKWTVLARIIQKYDRAVRKGGAAGR